MNSLAEALGMSLPGCAAIPAPYRERGQIAYGPAGASSRWSAEDLKPVGHHDARGLRERHRRQSPRSAARPTRRSTSNAIARHVGVELTIDDWERIGHDVPLLVNMQPAGKYLGEDFHRAGGVPAVVSELLKAGRLHPRDA